MTRFGVIDGSDFEFEPWHLNVKRLCMFMKFISVWCYCWEDSTLKSTDRLVPLYERAIRNCPWSVDLWIGHLQALECSHRRHDVIVGKCRHLDLTSCHLYAVVKLSGWWRGTVVGTSVYDWRTYSALCHEVQLMGDLLGVNRPLYVSQLSHSSSWGR